MNLSIVFYFARDKTWTYNPNSFNILLYQLSFTSFGDVRNWTWNNEVQVRSFTNLNYIPSYIRKTTRTFTKFHQYFLRIPCLPIPALGFYKAKVTWTLMITVMSSTLYQLSYSLIRGWRICTIVLWSWVKYVSTTLIRQFWTKWDSNPW